MIVTIRNGKVTGRLPFNIVGGRLVGPQGAVLIDGQAPGFGEREAEIKKLCAEKRWMAIPEEFLAKPGVNPSGLVVTEASEYDRQLASGPAVAERLEVQKRYNRISGEFRYSDSDSYFRLKAEADAAMDAWREKYPREAAEEAARTLEGEAASIEDNYCDLDGSISAADIADGNARREGQRQELRAMAAQLRKENNSVRM